MSETAPPTPSQHQEFNANDADLTIQSADGVLFKIHRKNLETNTGAFPGPEFDTKDEVVPLSEPANVLEIIFRFIYPRPHPALHKLKFELLLAVAEAVEKYEVAAARYTCNTNLIKAIPDHAKEVQCHAFKHRSTDNEDTRLIDEVLRAQVLHPLSATIMDIPSDYLLPWVRYHENWKDIFRKTAQTLSFASRECQYCTPSLIFWVLELEEIASVVHLKKRLRSPPVTTSPKCDDHQRAMSSFVKNRIEDLEERINTFPSFTHCLDKKSRENCIGFVARSDSDNSIVSANPVEIWRDPMRRLIHPIWGATSGGA